MNRPLCFVLMPFGKKPDAAGNLINFDAVYGEVIKPAIDAAAMEPVRADAVLAGNQEAAAQALGDALAAVREVWEPETTARNLRLIREARESRNEPVAWIREIITELERRAKG